MMSLKLLGSAPHVHAYPPRFSLIKHTQHLFTAELNTTLSQWKYQVSFSSRFYCRASKILKLSYLWHSRVKAHRFLLSISENYLLNWLFILLNFVNIYSIDNLHPQLQVSKGKHISSSQTHSVMNAVANKCKKHRLIHMCGTPLNCWQHFLHLPSVSCAYFTSRFASSPFAFLALPTDLWSDFDPLLLLVVLSLLHLLPSNLSFHAGGSVFRSEADTGNSWANLQ